MSLSETQLKQLYELFSEEISSGVFSGPLEDENETSFTGRVMLPWMQNWVSTLLKPELYVRGDGGPAINPVTWHGISFYPDLGVYSVFSRHVAVEIKILTSKDPSGSLTKAIGQTLMYERFGFAYSVGIIFNLLEGFSPQFRVTEKILINDNSKVFILSPF